LWNAAATTSITQREWLLNWSRTIIPGTLRWISLNIVRHTVASFSGLNTHNLTNRTFIHSKVLTVWIRSSTTMKRLCVHACNTKAVMQLSCYHHIANRFSVCAIQSLSTIETWWVAVNWVFSVGIYRCSVQGWDFMFPIFMKSLYYNDTIQIVICRCLPTWHQDDETQAHTNL